MLQMIGPDSGAQTFSMSLVCMSENCQAQLALAENARRPCNGMLDPRIQERENPRRNPRQISLNALP